MSECHATASPLKVRGNTQGIGNRIGWYLTVAALAESLGQRRVFTTWPNAWSRTGHGSRLHTDALGVGTVGHGGNRDYDFDEIRRIVRWPSVLRFLESEAPAQSDAVRQAFIHGGPQARIRLSDGTVLQAESIPHHPKPYVNDYVPECAFSMLAAWPRRRISRLPECLTRSTFLHAYARVQSQLRPRVPLCNPAPRSYIVLHVRRGDKLLNSRRDKGGVLAEALANATALPTVIARALVPIARATRLPFVVLTDGGAAYKAWALEQMERAGLRVLRAMGADAPLPPLASERSQSDHESDRRPCAPLGNGTARVLSDFFGIVDAAGVVVIAPKGVGPGQGLQESSFASVGALAGGTPHLTPVPFALGGKMASYRQRGNDGQPLRGIYFLDDLKEYLKRARLLSGRST